MKAEGKKDTADIESTRQAAPVAHSASAPHLVAHIVFRFDVGGLENGLVNLINHMPGRVYRHAIICLTDYSADFFKRIHRTDVDIYCLHKAPGKDFGCYFKLWRLLLRLKPAIVHTRNLGTIDCLPVAVVAGVPSRVHGEHGWDVYDLHGTSKKYRWLRRASMLFTNRYVVVSRQLGEWLHETVKIPRQKIIHVYNGVDTARFTPPIRPDTGDKFVIGYAGRFAAVKDPLNLVQAFIQLLQMRPELEGKVWLAMWGDGDLRAEAMSRLRHTGFDQYAELPGKTANVAGRLQELNLFVLPSRNEGISNTILEAMATGLPVVATRVGGNPELVRDNETGFLVPPDNPSALAEALLRYVDTPGIGRIHGEAGRRRVENLFSLQTMVTAYIQVYNAVIPRTIGKGA